MIYTGRKLGTRFCCYCYIVIVCLDGGGGGGLQSLDELPGRNFAIVWIKKKTTAF